MSGWYVVRFIDEDDLIEVVPSNWVLDNKQGCLWPPYTRANLLNAIKCKETPNDKWSTHKISMMTDKLYSKFVIATARATKAKFSSDISSGSETAVLGKRTIRPIKRFLNNSSSSSEDSDSELPQFPAIPAKRMRESLQTINEEGSIFENDIPDQDNTLVMPHEPNISKSCATTPDLRILPTTPRQSSSTRPSTTAINNNNLPIKPCEPDSRPGSRLFSTPHSSPLRAANQSAIIDEEWKQQVIRHLVIITNRFKEQNKLFDYIINHIEKDHRNENQPMYSNSDILKFVPITDDNSIEEIDVLLQEENNFNALVNAMARAGGDNASEIVRRIMTRLLTNEVAVLYSWHGHKGKKKFASLKLATVVYEAAKKQKNASLVTEKEVEIFGARWLTKALDRMKKRT